MPIKVNDTGNADKMRLVKVDQGPISKAGDPLPVSEQQLKNTDVLMLLINLLSIGTLFFISLSLLLIASFCPEKLPQD